MQTQDDPWIRIAVGPDLSDLLDQHTDLEGALEDLEIDEREIPSQIADHLVSGQLPQLAPLLKAWGTRGVRRSTLPLQVLLTRIALHRALLASPQRRHDPTVGSWAALSDAQLQSELDQLEAAVADLCSGGHSVPEPDVWSWWATAATD